jgi:hypothetical protein
MKAASIILNLISTNSIAGKQAWNLMAKYFDDEYSGGFHPKIWSTMKKW